jgi:hypothetical protein
MTINLSVRLSNKKAGRVSFFAIKQICSLDYTFRRAKIDGKLYTLFSTMITVCMHESVLKGQSLSALQGYLEAKKIL